MGPQLKINKNFLNKKCQELHGPLMVMSAIPPLNYGRDSNRGSEGVWLWIGGTRMPTAGLYHSSFLQDDEPEGLDQSDNILLCNIG